MMHNDSGSCDNVYLVICSIITVASRVPAVYILQGHRYTVVVVRVTFLTKGRFSMATDIL